MPSPPLFRKIAAMKKITIDTRIPSDDGQKMMLAASLAQTAAIFYVNDAVANSDEAIAKAILMYAEVLDRLDDANRHHATLRQGPPDGADRNNNF